MFWWKASKLGLLGMLPLVAGQPSQEPTVFHSGTRLVEVEVVVRDQRVRPPGVGASLAYFLDSGPPFGPPGALHKGLTKDDFTLLDQGKPQSIALFRTGSAGVGSAGGGTPVPLPPTAVSNRPVSNRQDSGGQPVNGATAVLIDFLNTRFGCRGYERLGATKLLRSFAETDSRIALYTLGTKLHALHDFTDDPQKLMEIAAKAAAQLDKPHDRLPTNLDSALGDLGDVIAVGGEEAEGEAAAVHGPMTVNALRLIIQHLSGVPGRKNLVWVLEDPRRVPPAVLAMAQQANVVLYPVLVRLVPGSFGPDASCAGSNIFLAQDLAAVTGGRAFFDVMDLPSAVRATEEDRDTAYVLGYYPPEGMLDGKYHKITLKIHGKALDRLAFEVHYRPGYLATKVAVPPPPPTLEEIFKGSLNSATIGLTAQTTPEAQHAGWYDVRVTVDLHDIHLDHKEGHFTGAFDLFLKNPSANGTFKTGVVAVDFKDEQLAEALEKGWNITVTGVESELGEIRVVVRDRATGSAGSLRVPVAKQ